MKNSADFDTWVTEQVGDLENFTQSEVAQPCTNKEILF